MITEPIESWRLVWRTGFAPVLPTAGLEALRDALAADDPRLKQGVTTEPPPLMQSADWPCCGGCPVAFALWRGGELESVGVVGEAFATACFEAGSRVGEFGCERYFLNWTDDTPRAEMRRELLAEVELALAGRAAGPAKE